MSEVVRSIRERYEDVPQDELRRRIEAQTCPWCGRGPFRSLATHTARVHEISATELREMAGLTKFESICSPDYSALRAEMRDGQRLPDHAYGEAQRKRRTLSDAGRRSQREKAARVSQEDRERAARASGDIQLAANADKHAEIVRRAAAGEGVYVIAKAVGMVPETVRRTLKREGVYVARRSRWHSNEQAE